MKLSCPNNPEHKHFETTAHVMQSWKVDETGEWVETLNDSMQVSFGPNFYENVVSCVDCGADAEIED